MSTAAGESSHVSVEELAAFLNAGMAPESRERIARHLESCERCRGELSVATGALMDVERPPRRRHLLMVAAAAVVATLMLVPLRSSLGPGAESTQRSERSEGTPTFEILAPRDGQTLSRRDVVFNWAPPEGASSYDLTLTNEAGDVVWSGRSQESSLTLPDSVELLEGRYYWVVDALLDRAREATTGVHGFLVAR